MFTAYYLPVLSQKKGVTKTGFTTEKEAWEYVYSQMCNSCKKELAEERAAHPEAKAFPACACEWGVGLTSEIDAAESFQDVLEACGWIKQK